MNLSEDIIKEFQSAVKDEYGIDMELVEATQILQGMVGYFDVLAKIDCKNKINS